MPKLLSGFIAKQLGKHLGKHVQRAVLVKVTPTARTAGAVSHGQNPTETEHRARGWIEEWSGDRMPNSNVRREVRKIALLGATIAGGAVPQQGDKVQIAERKGGPLVTYRVTSIDERDPDAAVWVVNVTK